MEPSHLSGTRSPGPRPAAAVKHDQLGWHPLPFRMLLPFPAPADTFSFETVFSLAKHSKSKSAWKTAPSVGRPRMDPVATVADQAETL